jgi:hypothetical protein
VEGETGTYFHRLMFQSLFSASLSPSETQDLIRRTAEEAWA